MTVILKPLCRIKQSVAIEDCDDVTNMAATIFMSHIKGAVLIDGSTSTDSIKFWMHSTLTEVELM